MELKTLAQTCLEQYLDDDYVKKCIFMPMSFTAKKRSKIVKKDEISHLSFNKYFLEKRLECPEMPNFYVEPPYKKT